MSWSACTPRFGSNNTNADTRSGCRAQKTSAASAPSLAPTRIGCATSAASMMVVRSSTQNVSPETSESRGGSDKPIPVSVEHHQSTEVRESVQEPQCERILEEGIHRHCSAACQHDVACSRARAVAIRYARSACGVRGTERHSCEAADRRPTCSTSATADTVSGIHDARSGVILRAPIGGSAIDGLRRPSAVASGVLHRNK